MMQKFLIIFLCCPVVVFGQNSSKLSVGISTSADYCYRSLTANNNKEVVKDIRNDYERPKFGFTGGISVLYQLKPQISLESGIVYEQKGFSRKKTSFLTADDFDPLTGTVKWSSTLSSVNYTVGRLVIPFKVRYYFLNSGSVRLFVTGGVSSNIFLNESRTIKVWDGNSSREYKNNDRPKEVNSISLAAIASVGGELRLSNRCYFNFEPLFKHDITPYSQGDIKEYLFSCGLNVGAFIRIKK